MDKEEYLRKQLRRFGKVWTKEQFDREFDLIGSNNGTAVVKKKSSGKTGTVYFTESPRFYYKFIPDKNG